ncbi:hypothetical protein SLS60_011191 [Paraconiothyrium brasiliense]|uniref:Uncharacterized protein n=1 Tax=Paraconiothyrium brasiliense TaxID=300254 RepID=A0ABR3QKV2_9PLEO
MLFLAVAPLLFNTVLSSLLHGHPLPAPTSRSIIAKRDDAAIPTISLGDMQKYMFENGAGYPDVTTPNAREVNIGPDGFHDTIPQEGLTFGLGPEITAEMKKIVEENCKDNKNLQVCIEKVHDTLTNTQLNTHSKRFLLLTAGAVAVAVPWIIAAIIVVSKIALTWALADGETGKLHLPHEDNGPLAQIETLGDDVDYVAFSTGEGDNANVVANVTITPTPAPMPNPDQSVSLEEVTADGDGHKKGSILMHIPEDLDRNLRDRLRVLGVQQIRDLCAKDREAHAITRRSKIDPRAPPPVSEECRTGVRNLARSSMFAMDDEMAMQMVPANPNNPANLETHPDGAAVPNLDIDGLNAAIEMARQYQQRRGANNLPGANSFYRGLIVASLVLRYVQEVALVMKEVDELLTLVEWGVEQIKKVTSKDALCPSDLVCFDTGCKGYVERKDILHPDDDPEIEQTGSCTLKSNKGCECEILTQPYVRPMSDTTYFDNLQQFMEAIDDSISHPTCSTDDSINFDTARMNEAIDGACKNHDELRRRKRHGAALSARDTFAYYNTDKDNLRWHLTWDDAGGQCSLKCKDVFNQMLYYEKCRWWGAAAKKGSVPTECGLASYDVEYVQAPSPPPPAPSDSPQLPDNWSQYLIIIEHEISGPGNWKLDWTLFADPWGVNAKVEGPAGYMDIGATSMEIHINVDDADNHEKAKIRFTIADRFNPSEKKDAPWYAGPYGDMGEAYFGLNWCGIAEKDSDWHDDNGVWKRKVRCGFAKDFGLVFKTGGISWRL